MVQAKEKRRGVNLRWSSLLKHKHQWPKIREGKKKDSQFFPEPFNINLQEYKWKIRMNKWTKDPTMFRLIPISTQSISFNTSSEKKRTIEQNIIHSKTWNLQYTLIKTVSQFPRKDRASIQGNPITWEPHRFDEVYQNLYVWKRTKHETITFSKKEKRKWNNNEIGPRKNLWNQTCTNKTLETGNLFGQFWERESCNALKFILKNASKLECWALKLIYTDQTDS